jgi:hypothetical protein
VSGKRPGLSMLLVMGAIVLVIAILVGNNMGNRVLGQISSRGAGAAATPIATPSPGSSDSPQSRALWKRRQVLSVATDPAFPDPRITPEPEPVETARPTRKAKTPDPKHPDSKGASSKPSDEPGSDSTPTTTYTSPAMPLPIVSHAAEETIAPDATQSLAPQKPPSSRSYPTLPPVSQPSLSP